MTRESRLCVCMSAAGLFKWTPVRFAASSARRSASLPSGPALTCESTCPTSSPCERWLLACRAQKLHCKLEDTPKHGHAGSIVLENVRKQVNRSALAVQGPVVVVCYGPHIRTDEAGICRSGRLRSDVACGEGRESTSACADWLAERPAATLAAGDSCRVATSGRRQHRRRTRSVTRCDARPPGLAKSKCLPAQHRACCSV